MTIITLIHGTWARSAEWTKDTSPLTIALKERIDDEVRIESFEWSGSNLHFMRRRAADDLQKHILSLGLRFPEAKQFLIAHSHGGNVALYALRNSEATRFVIGTVCLSTPFIQCRPRSFPGRILWAFLGAIVVVVPVYFNLSATTPGGRSQLAQFALFVLLAGATIGLYGLVCYWVAGRFEWMLPRDIYPRMVKSFDLPSLCHKELLILRARGDEASAALGASVFASWIFGRLSHSVDDIFYLGAWICHVGENLTLRTRVIGGLMSLCLGVYATFAQIPPVWPDFGISVISVIAWLLTCMFLANGFGQLGGLVQFIYVVLITPVLFVCSLFSVPFGVDAATVGAILEFSAEATPTGTFSVVSLKAPTATGLWHSCLIPTKKPLRILCSGQIN